MKRAKQIERRYWPEDEDIPMTCLMPREDVPHLRWNRVQRFTLRRGRLLRFYSQAAWTRRNAAHWDKQHGTSMGLLLMHFGHWQARKRKELAVVFDMGRRG